MGARSAIMDGIKDGTREIEIDTSMDNIIGLFPQVAYVSTYEKDMSKEIEFIKNIKYLSPRAEKRNIRSVDTHIIKCKEL